MANLVRKALKIFAEGAANTGVFGSAADTTKQHSSDPEIIQSKAAWGQGWSAATIGARKFPPLEEMQAVQFVVTYMLAYLFQKGIPEYDSSTTYYVSSIVRQPGTYVLYGSLTNDNMGNELGDEDQWQRLQDLSQTVQAATTDAPGIVQLATEAELNASSTSTDVPTAAQLVAHGFVTGDIKWTTLSRVQEGYIWASGNIGNATSGANNRANADCFNLFKAYWEDPEYTYTGATANPSLGQLQVYTSAGAAVSRGANALADWNANRRIAVPDIAGRVVAARNNMVTNAGRLSGQEGGVNGNKLGATGGFETHSLTSAQNGKHGHKTYMLSQNADTATPSGGIMTRNGGNEYSASSSDTASGANGQQIAASGEGSPHNNVQPTIIENAMIKL